MLKKETQMLIWSTQLPGKADEDVKKAAREAKKETIEAKKRKSMLEKKDETVKKAVRPNDIEIPCLKFLE